MTPESHVVSLALAEIHAAEVVADTVSAEDRESFFPRWRANDEMKEAGVLLIHGRLHIRAKPSEARAQAAGWVECEQRHQASAAASRELRRSSEEIGRVCLHDASESRSATNRGRSRNFSLGLV
jgi:hypothetical protein